MSSKSLCEKCRFQGWCRFNLLASEIVWHVSNHFSEQEADMLDAILRYFIDKCPIYMPESKKEGGESK